MQNKQLKTFLQENKIPYDMLTPKLSPLPLISEASAKKLAELLKIPEKELAKTVIVKIDGKLAMLVESAIFKTDLSLWGSRLGVKNIELASNEELQKIFATFEKEAIPPLGNFFKMDVYLDDSLASQREIVFGAGFRSEFIKMAYKDYVRSVKPRLFHIH